MRLACALAVVTSVMAAGCGGAPHGKYAFQDVDHRAEVAARLPGCAAAFDRATFPDRRWTTFDVDGDGAPDRVDIGAGGIVARTAHGHRAVRAPVSYAESSYVTRAQVLDGRLYVVSNKGVWRVDRTALRRGHVGAPVVMLGRIAGDPTVNAIVVRGCAPGAPVTVLAQSIEEGEIPECPFGGGDIHQPRQATLWTWIDDAPTVVRKHRVEDAELGCNS